MQENINSDNDESFASLLDESFSLTVSNKGQLIKGKVIRIDKDDVFIDLGLKSEGIIPIKEFYNKEGEPAVELGCEIEVVLENSLSSSIPKVSKQKADFMKERQRIKENHDTGSILNASILKRIKGGFLCDIGNSIEIRAFLPQSQLDIKPVKNLNDLEGKTIEVKIIQLDNKGIVISKRAHLEEQISLKKKELLESMGKESIIEVTIEKIMDQGALADINGLKGFIPIGELSWGRVRHPADILTQNQPVKVKIIKIENEGERITLSLKQTEPDPWENAKNKYKSRTKVKGKAVTTTDFGVFVELEPGVEGLVHISELSWTKNFKHPKEIVEIDSTLEVVVLEVNEQDRKISLSLRQIEPSPWQIFKDNNPPGTRKQGIIKNINEIGIFVEVEQDIVGLVRPENISWKGKVDPTEAYDSSMVEKEIEVSVLNVDPRKRKVALGIKQLTDDPWKLALDNYKSMETSLSGKVKEIKENALIIELENGVEGYLKTSELSNEPNTDLRSNFKLEDELTALVTGFDRKKHQINLSVKKLEQKLEKEQISSFMSSQGESSVKIGDIFSDELKSLEEK